MVVVALQCICKYRDAHRSLLLKAILQREGISAQITMDALLMDNVWVDETDLPRARPIVERFDAPWRDRATCGCTWTCPGCGETVDADFEICWKCQGPRPTSGSSPGQ